MDHGCGIIGVDLAKHVFQLHGAAADGRVVFRRREKLLAFFSNRLSADVRGGDGGVWQCPLLGAGDRGSRVRLVAPAYGKPLVKRQKHDAADAEAIVEAAPSADGGPTMRLVAAKSAEQQASAMSIG